MQTFLISLIFAPIVLPLLAARGPRIGRGLRLGVWLVVLFNLIYVFVVQRYFPSSPEEIP